MHLLGRDIVSEPTRRSARQLVATALTVFIAKLYQIDLSGLKIFEVPIDPKLIAGGAMIVILVQLATLLVHWMGDFTSLVPWNSAERENGVARWDVGSRIVDRIGRIEESVESVDRSAQLLKPGANDAAIDKLSGEIATARTELENLRRSALRLSKTACVYLYGLYLALPVATALLALFWPSKAP